ncbi:hypothetical protein T492DRAFT_867932 [Pavlovales sp. CCMP2436]|nr:hypothetical protein T492DRAFT_867932 [Pavlovales sp. CCMP2436]
MAHFVGGEVNPKLPEGCFDIRYEVKQLTRARVERFKATDDADHEPLTEAEFEILFKNSHSERVSFAMVGLGNDEVELFAPLLDPGRRHVSLCAAPGFALLCAAPGFALLCSALRADEATNSLSAVRGGMPLPHAGSKYCISLFLNNNKIGERGIETLTNALEQNTTLTELYLQYNK